MIKLNQLQHIRAVSKNAPYLKYSHHIEIHIKSEYAPIVGTRVVHFYFDTIEPELGEALCMAHSDAVAMIKYNDNQITHEDGQLWATIFGISPNQE